MTIPIPCPQCGVTTEHEERWRGCLRPCPRCDARVLVPEDDRLVMGPVLVEPTCLCGSGQVDPESGLWYRLRHLARMDPSERDDRLAHLFLFFVVPLLALAGAVIAAREGGMTDTDRRDILLLFAGTMLGPLVGYVFFYRAILRLLVPRLVRRFGRFTRLCLLPAARSPIYRNPDGSYTVREATAGCRGG